MSNGGWLEPRWDTLVQRKHTRANQRDWDESRVVARTGEEAQPAQYDPHLSDEELQAMEMGCVRDQGRLIRQTRVKRMYFRQMDREIGASLGQRTAFVYVEYQIGGSVHGRPITEEELRRKEAPL